ncbi:hypothetical protein P879_11686 [Paragonimus westermani]|uniref:Uncharacterized protein n=1 Tax=Paragonimus westermani TaxID=34504 RepID=A0A8T0DDQ8_9TREM|nr:hypothetical protein P879_11686 [Paragonimus westermani]
MAAEALQSGVSYSRNHWPEREVTGDLARFIWGRSAISITNGCVMFAECVVSRLELQPQVTRQPPVGHSDINRMETLTRSCLLSWHG